MKRNTKRISLLLAACALLTLLAACGGGGRDDVPVADIVTAVDAALSDSSGMLAVEESYVQGRLQVDTANCQEYAVKLNSSTNINEYGVFKAKDEDAAKTVAAEVEAYLSDRLSTWMDEYMPDEKPKLEAAEIKTQGVYVLYAILSDSDKTAAFSAFTNAIQ